MDLKMSKPFHPAKRKIKSFPVKKFKGDKILCFRMDSFAPESIKAFTDATQEINKTRKPPYGIIIDLRNCSGFDNENMLKVSSLCKSLKLTTVCLVGKNTSGDAELLAQTIAGLPKGIIMGTTSAGKPFDYKVIELKSGFVLMLPKIPAHLKELPEKTVKSSIFCKDNTSCMDAAIDLLSVVKIH
jgi:C-terminal processing protease CtpA/Prc